MIQYTSKGHKKTETNKKHNKIRPIINSNIDLHKEAWIRIDGASMTIRYDDGDDDDDDDDHNNDGVTKKKRKQRRKMK